MANSNNLLNKLRQNRQRAIVPSRDDTLVTSNLQPPKPDSEEDNELTGRDSSEATEGALEDLKSRLAKFPATHRRSGIVLEEEVDRQLTRFCKDHGVTVETFLEAAWQVAEADEGFLQKILVDAKRRYATRKEAGRLRRLITSLSRES